MAHAPITTRPFQKSFLRPCRQCLLQVAHPHIISYHITSTSVCGSLKSSGFTTVGTPGPISFQSTLCSFTVVTVTMNLPSIKKVSLFLCRMKWITQSSARGTSSNVSGSHILTVLSSLWTVSSFGTVSYRFRLSLTSCCLQGTGILVNVLDSLKNSQY